MNKIIITIILSIVCVSTCFAETSKKQDTQVQITAEENTVVVMKEVQGEVNGIMSNFISVIYVQNENGSRGMPLKMDKDTKVEGAKNSNLKGIKVGDIVSVKYEEKAENIEGTILISRLAKVITLITAAPQVLEVPDQSE
jgi:hypothetical protein